MAETSMMSLCLNHLAVVRVVATLRLTKANL